MEFYLAGHRSYLKNMTQGLAQTKKHKQGCAPLTFSIASYKTALSVSRI